ncbi:hypothetical protein [Photobacterium ganghwense]|uniref:hypothetical protein n=1 Tax=Photobacterium ganghwense TaxID=320778 RepID=UPI001A8FE885|nr:hypothetical protein [Photobacterium ganghwense]QSV17558.1 hypothetical protein FH974_25990 [Photobacterium ganghwense]
MDLIIFLVVGILVSGMLVKRSINKDRDPDNKISYMTGVRIAFTRAGIALVMGLIFGVIISNLIDLGWVSKESFVDNPTLFGILACAAGLMSFAAYHLLVGKFTGEETSLIQSFRYTLRELGIALKFLVVAFMLLALVVLVYDFFHYLSSLL